MMIVSMLTTTDNPHDPFDNFIAWNTWDIQAGYHTSAYLAKLTFYSREFPEKEINKIINESIDEIVKNNFSGVYKKVTREYPD